MVSQAAVKTHLVTDMRPIMPSDLSIATSCIGDAFMTCGNGMPADEPTEQGRDSLQNARELEHTSD